MENVIVILRAISVVNIMPLIAWNFPFYFSITIFLNFVLMPDAMILSLGRSGSWLSLSFFAFYIKGQYQPLPDYH
jgi:hypothetical protein